MTPPNESAAVDAPIASLFKVVRQRRRATKQHVRRHTRMAKVLTNPTFEEWLQHLFDHPVTDQPWYWDADRDSAELEPHRVVAYATRLFEDAGELLAPYHDAQAKEGLWFLISECTSPLYALTDTAVPLEERLCCIRAIATVFEQCFVSRCTPHFGHLGESGAGALNEVCYMWWDIFPVGGVTQDPAPPELAPACLSVMEAVLELPSLACQESALHGLGHWSRYNTGRCQSMISAFLLGHEDLRPELREYAARASENHVL